jgi:hypothetical protein
MWFLVMGLAALMIFGIFGGLIIGVVLDLADNKKRGLKW